MKNFSVFLREIRMKMFSDWSDWDGKCNEGVHSMLGCHRELVDLLRRTLAAVLKLFHTHALSSKDLIPAMDKVLQKL